MEEKKEGKEEEIEQEIFKFSVLEAKLIIEVGDVSEAMEGAKEEMGH